MANGFFYIENFFKYNSQLILVGENTIDTIWLNFQQVQLYTMIHGQLQQTSAERTIFWEGNENIYNLCRNHHTTKVVMWDHGKPHHHAKFTTPNSMCSIIVLTITHEEGCCVLPYQCFQLLFTHTPNNINHPKWRFTSNPKDLVINKTYKNTSPKHTI